MEQEKVYIDHNDIKNLFHCGDGKAYGIIRVIKSEYNALPLAGKILRSDFDKWVNGIRGGDQKRELV